ncbi:MAG: hypothetical protein IPK68_22345 [Bdellovibrionales bacterium]|nr:hypothetical protein [Bdellovibrionales bacterium]
MGHSRWDQVDGPSGTAGFGWSDGIIEEKHLIPDSIATRADLEKFRKSQEDIDNLVDYLNDFVKEQRARGGHFEGVDLLPSAFMVFGGKKFSLAWGTGAGVSATLGLVGMPVWVQKYDSRTNELLEEGPSMRMSTVLWPAADVGFGVGGGPRARLGLGFIWDLTHALSEPGEIWGAGPGLSWSPVTLNAGINVKIGVLSNSKLSGWVDFAYAAAALEIGPAAELRAPRLNITTMISGPAVMSYFDKASQDGYNATMQQMNRNVDELMHRLGPQLPPTEDGGKGRNKRGDQTTEGPDTHRP